MAASFVFSGWSLNGFDMTAREKILNVEAQVRLLAKGESDIFTCPFCEVETSFVLNRIPDLCCDKVSDVVEAVLDFIETKEQLQLVDRAMNRLAGSARPLLN